jgi:hypothetical protein
VQKELRLSPNQIKRIEGISRDSDAKSEPIHKEIKQLEKQIAELQKRIEELNGGISKKHGEIDSQRNRSLGKAAPDILSERSFKRLVQIQRQQRSLDEVLADVKMQRMLKIDDEQVKKIETTLKTEPVWARQAADYFGLLQTPGRLIYNNSVRLGAGTPNANALVERFALGTNLKGMTAEVGTFYQLHSTNLRTDAVYFSTLLRPAGLQKLFDVLNPEQQRTLLNWIGEPYQGNSWQGLRMKEK